MTEQAPKPAAKNELSTAPRIIAEIHSPRITPWSEIGKDVMDVSTAAFIDYRFSPNENNLRNSFEHPSNTVILLQQGTRIIGFSYAFPSSFRSNEDTAHVGFTAIHPDFQGQKLLPLMLRLLDEALKERNFNYLQREVRIKHGYADIIERAYKGKIRQQHNYYDPESEEWKRFFEIKL